MKGPQTRIRRLGFVLPVNHDSSHFLVIAATIASLMVVLAPSSGGDGLRIQEPRKEHLPYDLGLHSIAARSLL